MAKKIDITGERYGRLTVIKEVEQIKTKRRYLCRCDCGKEIIARMESLRSGNTQSCGCFKSERVSETQVVDLTGHRYGHLTVLERSYDKKSVGKAIHSFWLCRCDCGKQIVVSSNALRSGHTLSCGHLRGGRRVAKKGQKERKLDAPRSVSPGDRYNNLVAVERLPEKLHNEEAWSCKCDCGSETVATKSQLLGGRKKSCGCLRRKSPSNLIDLTGMRFGALVVIKRNGRTEQDNALWLCKCACGNNATISGTLLRRREAVSCGCQKTAQIKHARSVLLTEETVDGVQVPRLTQKVRSDSSTGYKGIRRRDRNGKVYYEAYITVKGKRISAAPKKTLEEAVDARRQLEEEYHKPYIEALEERKMSNNEWTGIGVWSGWKIIDGHLISPDGRKYAPGDIVGMYNQADLARTLGVTKAAIQDRIKRGTLPPFDEGKKWRYETIKHLFEPKS